MNKRAPKGHVYVCAACGKTSRWKYGFDHSGKNDASHGWDESCAMHAELVAEDTISRPTGWTYPRRVTRVGDDE